jgi:hypothetical protein
MISTIEQKTNARQSRRAQCFPTPSRTPLESRKTLFATLAKDEGGKRQPAERQVTCAIMRGPFEGTLCSRFELVNKEMRAESTQTPDMQAQAGVISPEGGYKANSIALSYYSNPARFCQLTATPIAEAMTKKGIRRSGPVVRVVCAAAARS